MVLRARVCAAFLPADFALAVVRPEDFAVEAFFDADRLVDALRVAVFLVPDFFAAEVLDVDFLRAVFLAVAAGPFAPPSCLLTVAHARLAAVFFETPFFS